MKIIGFCLTVILLISFRTNVSFAEQSRPDGVPAIGQLLRSTNIERIEIIYYPEEALTMVALTPEMLEKQYQYKLVINDVQSSKAGKEIITAVESERFTASDRRGDFRWGCSFYNDKGERVTSLYFDAFGKVAMSGAPFMTSHGHALRCLRKVCAGFRK